MSFIWPFMFVFLLVIPLVAGLYITVRRRRRQAAARFGSLGLLQGAAGQAPGLRASIPAALFLAGLTILVIALARPQAEISMPRVEGTVILAFDVSGSMAAEDLQPTRMEAARVAATNFVERQPSSMKIGVVAFSDSGFSVQTPTNVQEDILAAINRLEPQRSTSLGRGILASLNVIEKSLNPGAAEQEQPSDGAEQPTPTPVPAGTYVPAVIVLLTDGENTAPPNPFEAAQVAADRGVRIYTIGIGSAAGINLEVEGFNVHTRLDEAALQQIAQLTDGEYYNAQDEQQLQTIYENITPRLVIKPERTEVTSVFAGASILILLVGGIASLFWFNRLP